MARWTFVLASAALFGAAPARALEVEKLVMPGPVIRGHADVEGQCARCHAPFHPEAQDGLCLDCHADVGADLHGGTGFHGLHPGASKSSCKACHGDHQGREAEITGLDAESFDHGFTDFSLVGAHQWLACERCHDAKVKFRETRGECVDCHAADDAHEGRLGDRCGDCHTAASWKEARFDHEKTRFPLTGRHQLVKCGLCHTSARYENTPRDCQSCHGISDVHQGRFGPDCGRCHGTDGWKSTRFDHDRDTKFPLRGSHRKVTCDTCHKGDLRDSQQTSDCISCHLADDVHRGRYGTRCDECHGEWSWGEATFDHDRSTKFPLREAHRIVRCQECHMGSLHDERLSTECISCHREDDVHGGQQGTECGRCHGERGWMNQVFFDHDLTRFPLLGLHAVSSCEQCHLTPRFKDAPIECVECHASDDIHVRRLGTSCGECHNPNGWLLWKFDHDRQTDFPLRGGHAKLDCHACHQVSIDGEMRLSVSCVSCHAEDDVHYGGFGQDCGRCHGDASWADIEMLQ